MASCLIGLGANLGDRQATLARAVAELAATTGIVVVGQSRLCETAPVGGPAGQGAYLNGAVTLETSLDPLAVFDRLRQIEQRLGRERKQRWGARAVDLDLLLYEQVEIESPRLTVPHPRMAFRRFVLQSAAEVAAEMIHRPTGWSVGRLLAHLDNSAPYVAIAGFSGPNSARLADEAAREVGGRFLADPAGDVLQSIASDLPLGLERLSRRASALARNAWPRGDGWTFSDFWFDQSLAWAAIWLDAAGQSAVTEAWQALRGEVTSPRLLVVLDLPPPTSHDDSNAARRAQTRAALLAQSRQNDTGPVLWLSDDEATSRTELLAALGAMR